MIITGGFNVYAREVEDVLEAHSAIAQAAVFGVPDREWGEPVAAAIVAKPGTNLDEEAVVRHCREHLTSYKKPKLIRFVSELPRNTVGRSKKRSCEKCSHQNNRYQFNSVRESNLHG